MLDCVSVIWQNSSGTYRRNEALSLCGVNDAMRSWRQRLSRWGGHRRMLRWIFSKLQQRQIDSYLLKLRAMDADEIGNVVALAAHMRNKFLDETGIDLLDPYAATAVDPDCVIKLSKTADYFQKKGMIGRINAAGIMVWIHTLRATINPDIRMTVRAMWGELSRGFPYVQDGARFFKDITGDTLDLSDAGRYPDGLTPQPK